MGRKVGYADAVKLLGGDQAAMVKLLDGLLGAGMLVLLGPFRDLLGWLDAKAELGRITEEMVRRLADRRSEYNRYERTERLQAAHAVLALTAFFEAMAEVRGPLAGGLELTAEEQRSLGRTDRVLVAGWSAPVPGPTESHEDFRDQLEKYYGDLAVTLCSERIATCQCTRSSVATAFTPRTICGRSGKLILSAVSTFQPAGSTRSALSSQRR